MEHTIERHMFSTPNSRPVEFYVRAGTSDWNTCNAITSIGDEYHIPEGLSGWALDVGAHIGACAVALLVDNPDLHVVAAEALPENVDLIRQNLELNGVADRCVVVQAAAGDGLPVRIGYGSVTDPTGIHEYIGNAYAPPTSRFVEAVGFTLPDALRYTDGEGFAWAKLDCESCEHPFLASGGLEQVGAIEGEVHRDLAGLRAILEPTHVVTDDGKDFGMFKAVPR